jgi:hypothetical protein
MKNLLVLLSLLCFFNANSVAQPKSTSSKKRSISSSIKDSITTTEKKNNTTKSILNNYYDENGYLLFDKEYPKLLGYNPNQPILENEEKELSFILTNIHLIGEYHPGKWRDYQIFNFSIQHGKITSVTCGDKKYINVKDSLFFHKIKVNQKRLTHFYIPVFYKSKNEDNDASFYKSITLKGFEVIGIDMKMDRFYDSIRLKNEINRNFKSEKYQALTTKDLNLINRLNRTYNTNINPNLCIIEHNDYIIDTTKIERQIKYGCYGSNEDRYRFKIIYNYSNKNELHIKNGKYFEDNDIVFYNDSSFLTISKKTDYFRRNLSYSPIIIRLNNSFIFNKQDTIVGSYLIQNPLFKDSLIYIHSEFHRYENPFQLIKIESYKKVKTFRFGFFKRSYLLELKIKGSFPKMVDSSIYLYVSKKGEKSIVKNKILDVFQVMSKSDSLKINYYEIRYNHKINYFCDSVNVRLSTIGIQYNTLIPDKYNHSKFKDNTTSKTNLIGRKIVGYIYYRPLNFYYKSINYLKYQCRVGFNAKKNDPTGKYKDPIIYYLEKRL